MRPLDAVEKVIVNAIIIGLITFFSTMNVSYPPTMANFYAAIMGSTLAMVTQLKTLTHDGLLHPPKLGLLL